MKKTGLIFLMTTLTLFIGCSKDDNGVDPNNPPSVPTNLVAVGSLGNIHLSWDASSGEGLLGYNIDRSTDGVNFYQRNGDPVVPTEFDDTDVLDGVVYYYRIMADGNGESAPSNIVKEIHGTRLQATYDNGLTIESGALNPYVVEDTVVINDGNLVIQDGAKLYLKGGAVLDMDTFNIRVYGLLRVVATADANATITGHKVGSELNDGEGFRLQFDDADDFDAINNTGCLIQNTRINNLHYSNNAIDILNCSPRIYNCKITANMTTGGSYFEIRGTSAPIIENCSINNIVLAIRSDLRSTTALIQNNFCRDGYYSLYFAGLDNPAVTAGQIAYNNFDGNVNGLRLNGMSGDYSIPLGNNYWDGGVPSISRSSTDITVLIDFSPALVSAPTGCGPNW